MGAAGEIEPDAAQDAVAERLDALVQALAARSSGGGGLFARFQKKTAPVPRGRRRIPRICRIIHSGEVEIRSATGKIFGRIGSGQAFGIRALLGGGRATYRAVALKDGTVLRIPRDAFMQIADIHPQFERYFEPIGIERVGLSPLGRNPAPAGDDGAPAAGLDLMVLTARDMMTKNPVSVTPADTANAAARIMRDRRISCVPVVEGDSKIVGIVTDADFRDRVVASTSCAGRSIASSASR